jgi:hypothetical protein
MSGGTTKPLSILWDPEHLLPTQWINCQPKTQTEIFLPGKPTRIKSHTIVVYESGLVGIISSLGTQEWEFRNSNQHSFGNCWKITQLQNLLPACTGPKWPWVCLWVRKNSRHSPSQDRTGQEQREIIDKKAHPLHQFQVVYSEQK